MAGSNRHTHAALDAESASPARLDLIGVSVGYNGAPVLRDVTAQIPHGARVAVVGPNGAGKSTLFKALVGLLPLRSGQVFIHGLPLGKHAHDIAYVPQREDVDWRFPVTVSDVVMMGRYGRLGWLRRPGKRIAPLSSAAWSRWGSATWPGAPLVSFRAGSSSACSWPRPGAGTAHLADGRAVLRR